MAYTIKQLAKLANVSVRTLHYYDEVGLLKPERTRNDYRQYEDGELFKLQQILFFRELDFPLEEIKKIIDQPDFDIIKSLDDQKALIKLRQKRLGKLVYTINKTIKHMKKEKTIKDEELYDAFKDDDVKQYQEEVKERWGSSDAYKQSMARVSKMTKAEMDKLKEDGKKFTQLLADSMDKNLHSEEVQALVEEHYKGIQFFYECPLEMYRNLGNMYVDDPRFTAYYDKFRPGLAVFLRDAINIFCDKRE
ncbi:MAG: Transcriptional regulator, MerR family [Parcubacteria group bacterium GW2011_GWE2_39_37]|uniref:Transcriptional regulator, MerR family n=1 Tax=Candidatus Falkowbacteria bacterium GW2011_GWF2_39_8 TaxID=1618642 RepID=A0A0G0PV76_9BACT|nr:MAG: Transcriptional regulator, MerR family [Parcubacteria group bacterium GW2011_GWE2_39_37]KKR32069.1 MAG: Transcriptional regulator, MerR family [Candidatus Falkowbacteria bacterium GW2011_GWF2_39_8]